MGLYIKQNGAIKPLAGSTPGEGLPVGAITAFTANSIPSGWLLCDGSTFDETLYPALFLALGGNVLPDLRNRFLEGADSVIREYKEAGLPNITGRFAAGGAYPFQSAGNAFSLDGRGNYVIDGYTAGHKQYNGVSIDASKGETKTDGTLKTEDEAHVYGNSDTVQPASYTVNYIIKATSGITTEAALDAFNMIKEYERKQNLLSDIETLELSETDTVMPYDGYISVYFGGTADGLANRRLIINGITVGGESSLGTTNINASTMSYLVKKGDNVRLSSAVDLHSVSARWYKLRDYSGR